MNESPIFTHTYKFVLWLLPQVIKFPRQYRFTLAERVQRHTLDFQETILAAGLKRGPSRADYLHKADAQLAQLRHTVRLCKDLKLIRVRQYEFAAEQLAEIGRLLGGWLKAAN